MYHTVVAGIDPGVAPAVAVVQGPKLLGLYRLDDETAFHSFDVDALREIFKEHAVQFAVVERVGVMAKQGVCSVGALMLALGLIRGALHGASIPYAHPTPQTWKKIVLEDAGYDMGRELDDPKKHQKNQAVICALKHFPSAVLVKPRCRTPDHNLAEALLLAKYADLANVGPYAVKKENVKRG